MSGITLGGAEVSPLPLAIAFSRVWLLLALAQPVLAETAAWDRTMSGPGPANAYAAWPPDQVDRMRRTQQRFCANLRLVLGISRLRRGAFCHAAVERDMREGLTRLRERAEPQSAPPGRDRAEAPSTALTVEAAPLLPLPGATRGAETSAAEVFNRAQGAVWLVLVEGNPGERGGAQVQPLPSGRAMR